MKAHKIIYGIVVFLMAAGISLSAEKLFAEMNAPKDNIYTEDKPSIVVNKSNSQFAIKLKSNPTTGYAWFLREYNGDVIMPVRHHFEKADNGNLMGAPGYEVWTFRVKPTGFTVPQQTTIRFVYARPWQSADSTNQVVFRVTTQVNNK